MPIPMFSPMPPLLLREDKDTPMMVRIKEEKGMASREFFWIRANLMLVSPRRRRISMKRFNCLRLNCSTDSFLLTRSAPVISIRVSSCLPHFTVLEVSEKRRRLYSFKRHFPVVESQRAVSADSFDTSSFHLNDSSVKRMAVLFQAL